MTYVEATDKFMEYLRSHDRSAKTLYGYQSDIKAFKVFYEGKHNLPWRVEDTTLADIESFMTYLYEQRGLQPATRNRILNCLRSFFRYLHTRRIIDVNPAQGVETIRYPRRERVHLTESEYEQLVHAIDRPLIKAATQILYYTGLRISELIYLCMKDVDFERAVIHVSGKGRQNRNVPISDNLRPILMDYVVKFRRDADQWHRLLSTVNTGRISASWYNFVLHETTMQLRWEKNVTAHTLRHTFATRLIRCGVSVVDVQKLLGHSSLTVTSIYTHATSDDLAHAVNKL